jgi:ParB-like chromosome segregation protein Spo0J
VLDELINTGTNVVSRETQTVTRVALDRIVDNPFQYRRHYNEAPLRELAININSLAWQLPKTSGLQQPGMGRLVRRDDAGVDTPVDPAAYANQVALTRLFDDPAIFVQIAYGHRRVRAFHVLANGPKAFFPVTRADEWPTPDPGEFGTFPIQLAHLDDQAMAEFALTENSQREDVSAIEEAALLQRMIDELGMSLDDVGRKFGWSRPTVSNKLRLLRLPERVQRHVLAGELTEKHARMLLRVEAVPAVLASLADKCRSEMWPTRRLEEKITEAIRSLPAVVDAKTEMPGTYGTSTRVPPWDLTWSPAGEAIRGACAGCPARVVFGNEPGPRCTDTNCWTAKGKLWPAEDEARQRAAAADFLARQNGADLLINTLDPDGVRPVPLLAKTYDYRVKDVHVFNPNVAEEATIVKLELCGPHCKCFAACYETPSHSGFGSEPYRTGRWRPCPEEAPDISYCCTDVDCFKMQVESCRGETEARKQAAEAQRMASDPAYAEMRKQREERDAAEQTARKENKQQAQRRVDAAVAAAGGIDALWANRGFLVDLVRMCVSDYYRRPTREELASQTVAELHAMIVGRVMLDQFHSGGMYDLTGVQSLANLMAPPPPQPKPGDSQKTDWQAAWDIEDEACYQNIMGAWDGGNWGHLVSVLDAQPPTPRTLLRLIESCPRKEVRAQLWTRHNGMQGGQQ